MVSKLGVGRGGESVCVCVSTREDVREREREGVLCERRYVCERVWLVSKQGESVCVCK